MLLDNGTSFDFRRDVCRSPETGTCGFSGAVANLAVTAVGAGMLALPKAYSSVGLLLGFSLTVLVSFLTYFSSSVIIRYCAREQTSYSGLVHSVFGLPGARTLQASIIVHVFGVMIVYLIIISDMLVGSPPAWDGLLPYFFGRFNQPPFYLSRWFVSGTLVAIAVTPMLISRNLSTVARFSRFSVCLLLLLAGVVVCLAGVAVATGREADDVSFWPPTQGGEGPVPDFLSNASTILTVLAVSALASTCQFNLVPVHNSLADNRTSSMLRATRAAISLTAALYATMAVAGYILFGSSTDGDVLKNLTINYVATLVGRRSGEGLILFIVAANTGNLLVNFVLKVWAVRESTCEFALGCQARDLKALPFYGVTAALTLGAYGVALVIPSMWLLVGLIGSTACVSFSYLFPGLILFRKSRLVRDKVMGGGAVLLAVIMASVAVCNALTGNADV